MLIAKQATFSYYYSKSGIKQTIRNCCTRDKCYSKTNLTAGIFDSLSGKAETFKESFDSLYFASILA